MFTDRLRLGEMVAIALAAPPGSAVRHALDAGWSRGDHLLANLHEQMGEKTNLESRYERPGVPKSQTQPKRDGIFPAESMTMDELDTMMAENYARGPSTQLKGTT